MAARAISSGTISFGLVSIPVKLYSATASKGVHFHMLHATDRSRVRQQWVCASCGELVERSKTVRGYEYAKDHYVVLEEEELKSLEKQADRSIEIEEFVPITEVDPLFFDGASLLGPDKGGQKAYRLLHQAMSVTGQVAMGRFATRGHQQLVLIRPVEDGLVLHSLLYADEVRSFDDLELGEAPALKSAELDLARRLVEQLSSPRFDASRYHDEYREAVLQLVERKVAGEEVVAAPAPAQREHIIDLVAALKRSLAERTGSAAAAGTQRERKPAKAKGRAAARRKSASR